MSHYKSNVRDQEFNLFEVLGVDKALGEGEYSDLDVDTVREMLGEITRLAEGPIAESFADCDRNPPVFDPKTHTVDAARVVQEVGARVIDGGWDKIGLDEELGGMPMPRAVQWALMEHVLGANPAVYMYAMGAGFAEIIYHLGTEEQKKWAVLAAERGWTSTMVLTEPDAGSDVGAGRTKAVQQDDGSWHIDGVKRFITSGDVDDLGENIVHLVLARPEGAGPGTKGLSLFIVPKFHFDPRPASPASATASFVTNVEHKMGIKVSATCELTLGARRPGRGLAARRGPRRHRADVRRHRARAHDGRHQVDGDAVDRLPQRARLREDACPGRRPDSDDGQDRAARRPSRTPRRAPHADDPEGVRRGPARAVPVHRDVPGRRGGAGRARRRRRAGREAQRPAAAARQGRRLREGLRKLTESLQTFGGSGLLQDYPIEQYIRDAKIDSLYEGTTDIQALDFFFRKIVRDKGVALGLRRRPDRRVRQERVRQRPAEEPSVNCWPPPSPTCRAWRRR